MPGEVSREVARVVQGATGVCHMRCHEVSGACGGERDRVLGGVSREVSREVWRA